MISSGLSRPDQLRQLIRFTQPVLWVTAYWGAIGLLGGLNADTLGIGIGILIFSYTGPKTKALLHAVLPVVLTYMIYDSMRYYADSLRASYIRVREPYEFDKAWFGITTEKGILTPNEWLQLNTHWALDLVTGFFYLAFFVIFALVGVYFRFWPGKSQAQTLARQASSRRMMLAFFWTNMLGYSTYYWYPAAPPWYVALHGLGTADLTVGANAAGALRFDALLGIDIFRGMYGKSADVFGAIPSLHVAYPLLAMLHAFELKSLRLFGTAFYLVMCFAAVYLNHHYVLDILWGSAYAALVYAIIRFKNPLSQPA
ncbi:MAG: phosphatase PAP2 family protein [Oligoflexia bacterium]